MKSKIATISLLFSTLIFAHGMNKPGPNGGYIKMPSSYHVELLNLDSTLKIFLLDINFKNPTVNNSSVNVEFKGTKSYNYSCSKGASYFICPKPNKSSEQFNKIIVHTARETIKASPAEYNLPLKFE